MTSLVVLIVFIDGFIKPHTPGSLLEPAKTYMFPANWATLPLSFGLLMSPWGGHSVFPNIYRDMRHPHKFTKSLNVTYVSVYCLDLAMGVAGLLMFGDSIRDEVTSNILLTSGYPKALSVLIVVFIAIIPLTKVPLNARPIVSAVEQQLALDVATYNTDGAITGYSILHVSSGTRNLIKFLLRILTNVVIVCIAIVFPSFDSIMALLGSAMCFTICIILPLMFYLKIFGKEISMRERIFDYFLIVVCSILASIGTVWAFLPKDMIGASVGPSVTFL
jgi:solute carrier family 32 (vesicular inhibitory amino acid transporter)